MLHTHFHLVTILEGQGLKVCSLIKFIIFAALSRRVIGDTGLFYGGCDSEENREHEEFALFGSMAVYTLAQAGSWLLALL